MLNKLKCFISVSQRVKEFGSRLPSLQSSPVSHNAGERGDMQYKYAAHRLQVTYFNSQTRGHNYKLLRYSDQAELT